MAVLRPEPNWSQDAAARARAGEPDADPITALLGLAATGSPPVAGAPAYAETGFRGGDAGGVGRDEPTETLFPDAAADRLGWHVRLFGSHDFFRLWIVQVVSATGDWLGFAAVIVLAASIGGGGVGAGAGAISLVMAARIVPGFFFGPVAGVLVDRWDRKRVMVSCDLGRAVVIGLLPFVRNLAGLVLASLLLEVMTLLWSPAKEASVPNLVPQDHLTTANSLSLAAAYGTFPFASLLFALLAGVSVRLASVRAFEFLSINQMALAFYFDAATFLFAAGLVASIPLGRRVGSDRRGNTDVRRRLRAMSSELAQGWHEIFRNHTIRAVNIGMATGLIGGGMLIPLGAVFSAEVLGAGPTGYGLFTTALGFGVAVGVVGVSALQRRLNKAHVFTGSLFLAGASLMAAATASTLALAALFVAMMGVTIGPVYVMGYVLLQEEVDDDLRGRVFSSLNTLVRLCVLLSMVAGPLLAALLGSISEDLFGGRISVASWSIAIPGVRLTLWLAAMIIMAAGVLALHSVRSGQRYEAATAGSHPSRGPGRDG